MNELIVIWNVFRCVTMSVNNFLIAEIGMIRTIYLSTLTTLACAGFIFSLSTALGLNAGPIVLAAITTGLVVSLVNVVANIMNPVIGSEARFG